MVIEFELLNSNPESLYLYTYIYIRFEGALLREPRTFLGNALGAQLAAMPRPCRQGSEFVGEGVVDDLRTPRPPLKRNIGLR